MQLDDRKTNYIESHYPELLGNGRAGRQQDHFKIHRSEFKLGNHSEVKGEIWGDEMGDWKRWGYIIQPHTSAGRIPSDKGYRFYVDTMMATREQEVNEMKDMLYRDRISWRTC